jgi:hypothetical protein
VGDAQPPAFAVRLGDHHLPHWARAEHPGLQIPSQLAEEGLDTAHGLDVVGTFAIHPGRPRAPVGPHPLPGQRQHSGVTHEIEHIIEPATRIVACPSVQLALDPQYPPPQHAGLPPEHHLQCRNAGIHLRPPDLPVTLPRTRCPPSPCDRLSRPPTTTRAPPHPAAISRPRACPLPAWRAGETDGCEMLPTFTADRSMGEAPSFSPAASPRVRRRPSPWPPRRPGSPAPESPDRIATRRALRTGPYPPDWSRFWT